MLDKIQTINSLDEDDRHSQEYREWDTFMYGCYRVARTRKDSTMMGIIGTAQREGKIDYSDASKLEVFAKRNSIRYTK